MRTKMQAIVKKPTWFVAKVVRYGTDHMGETTILLEDVRALNQGEVADHLWLPGSFFVGLKPKSTIRFFGKVGTRKRQDELNPLETKVDYNINSIKYVRVI